MLKRLMALIIGVSLIVTTSVAFGGPVERFFHQKNYVRAVYDILVKHEITVDGVTTTATSYGQGFGIGPHYILTAAHVVSTQDSITFIYTQPAKDKIISIKIVSHHTLTTDGGWHSTIYEYYDAKVVERGTDSRGDFENDWAILYVEELLEDYVICRLEKNIHAGDDVWNITGNASPVSYPLPQGVVGDKLYLYDAIYEFGELTLFKTDPLDVYVVYPTAVGGDSGSPVFDKDGFLIGILVGGGIKLSVICKAEKFADAFGKYSGK